MRRRAGVGVLVAAAVALGGCGGDDESGGSGGGEALSKTELAKEAQAVCKRYDAEDLGSPDLNDPKQAEEYFAKAQDLAQEQIDELKALEPVESVKADYDAFTAAQQDAVDLLGDIVAAAKAEDREEGVKLLQQFEPAATKIQDTAKAVGIKGC